jgi:hypothetical protein
MLDFLDAGLELYDYKNNNVPLVMIGHSKDFFNEKQFDKFLKIATEKYLPTGEIRFTTFREFVENNLE